MTSRSRGVCNDFMVVTDNRQTKSLAVETVIGEDGQPVVDGDLPPWMLEELGREAMPPQPDHPRELGVPGRSFDASRPEIFRHEK